jgi:hypothetical protein
MPLIPAGALALAALAMIPGVVATARDRVPLFVGLGLLWCGTLVTALGAATLDYDRDNPYPVDLALVRDASQGQARWWTMSFNGPPPPSMVQAGFGPQTQPLLYGYPAFPGPGSALGLGPGLEITELQRPSAGGGTIRGRLRSARGSTVGWLLMTPPEVVRGVRLDGQPVSGLRVRSGDGEALSIRLHGLPSEGTPMEIDVTSAERLHVRAADVHFGLPAGEETARWTAIRPQWAAPLQFGDVDLVFTEFDL